MERDKVFVVVAMEGNPPRFQAFSEQNPEMDSMCSHSEYELGKQIGLLAVRLHLSIGAQVPDRIQVEALPGWLRSCQVRPLSEIELMNFNNGHMMGFNQARDPTIASRNVETALAFAARGKKK